MIAGGALLAMTATIGSLSLVLGCFTESWPPCVLVLTFLPGNECRPGVACAVGNADGFCFLLGGAIGALFSPVGLIAAAFWLRRFSSGNTGNPLRRFMPGVQRDYGKADPVARNL